MLHFIDINYETDERYDLAKFLEYFGDNHDPLNSFFLTELNKLSEHGQYFVESESNRPDLISFRIYGDTQYWWIIMHYNNLLSYEDVTNRITIRYPSINDLEDLFFRLKSIEAASI